MPTVNVYNLEGGVTGQLELDPKIFSVAVKPAVVHQVVTALEANRRPVLSHAKTKAEVRGGGRKPWKQKGTGRARQGSTRNPQWIGGGVAHGPKAERNYQQKVNRRLKKMAVLMVLSDKLVNDNLLVVDNWQLPTVKTKALASILAKLPKAKQSSLLVTAKPEVSLKRAAANLPKVEVRTVNSLNPSDLLKYQRLLLSQTAVQQVGNYFAL